MECERCHRLKLLNDILNVENERLKQEVKFLETVNEALRKDTEVAK